jgi:hypothetical protein
MSRYSYKKSYVWGSDIAYVVGLFASDGCLINNGRHLNITSKDAEIIDNVLRILNKNVKVSLKKVIMEGRHTICSLATYHYTIFFSL